jgi:hypothetical protein
MLQWLFGSKGKKLARAAYVRPANIKEPEIVSEIGGHQLTFRTDIAKLLPDGGVGIELGVAEGTFSDALLSGSKLEKLYSVDMWMGDHKHDDAQYQRARDLLAKYGSRNEVLRMRFDQALPRFPDEHFDFIYVDGYAHTGEENGQTFRDWWPKLKPGGLFAGDDYDPHWPFVMETLDAFAHEWGLPVKVIPAHPDAPRYSRYPSWLIFKPSAAR